MAYLTVAELRAQLGIDDSIDDDTLSLAVESACQMVDDWCGRTFNVPTATSVRTLAAEDTRLLLLPFDLASTASLVVKTDDNDDGTYETTWTITTDYVPGPRSYGLNGQTAWPYSTLTAVGGKVWPTYTCREAVQVTGMVGWSAIPAPVKSAAVLLAKDLWKSKDTFGGVAGFGEFGALRVRQDPTIQSLLRRYRSPLTVVPIA